MKKILVTGSNGQLGSEIKSLSNDFPNFKFIFVDRFQLPLDSLATIFHSLTNFNPDYIINCAAYTAVDKAETQPELADTINHQAVEIIARWCFENQCKLIHISTDYVFDGSANFPLKETDVTNPQNVYGQTKLSGEIACLKANPESIIIRTAWVYSEFGNNFVKTMLRLMKEKVAINVVNDQFGCPTYAKDLAETILKIIEAPKWHFGIYHYSNQGEISWYDFANTIKKMAGLSCEIIGIPSSQYPTPAKRPHYSLLDNSKIQTSYNISSSKYDHSLRKCLENIKQLKSN